MDAKTVANAGSIRFMMERLDRWNPFYLPHDSTVETVNWFNLMVASFPMAFSRARMTETALSSLVSRPWDMFNHAVYTNWRAELAEYFGEETLLREVKRAAENIEINSEPF